MTADPPTERRSSVRGQSSARSVLLTVLGEFVHPAGRPVWTAALVDALGLLGIEEKAGRQALNRTAREGIIIAERHGRRTLWDLTPHGHELLTDGTERIYGFLQRPRPWDGRWLVLSVPIAEAQRPLRHRLRTRLTWLGMGSPSPGLWVSPDPAVAEEMHAVVRSLGLADQAFAVVGESSGLGEETRVLGGAWDLGELARRYQEFVDRFSGLAAFGEAGAFAAQVELVEAWRRFPFLDPQLPVELLPDDWPGDRAAAVFHERHAAWRAAAIAEWDRLTAASGPPR